MAEAGPDSFVLPSQSEEWSKLCTSPHSLTASNGPFTKGGDGGVASAALTTTDGAAPAHCYCILAFHQHSTSEAVLLFWQVGHMYTDLQLLVLRGLVSY